MDVLLIVNPCNMMSLLGLVGLTYILRIRKKTQIRIESRSTRQYTLLSSKYLDWYRRFYVAGCVSFIITGTIFNPFYDFVPSIVSLLGIVLAFGCFIGTSIIVHRYGIKREISRFTHFSEDENAV